MHSEKEFELREFSMTTKFLFLLILAGFLWSCGSGSTSFSFGNRQGENTSTESTEVESGRPPDPATGFTGMIRTDQWVQPQVGAAAADVIFVVDTSWSMWVERDAIATALEGLLDQLDQDQIDVCVGVMLGHVGPSSGLLYAASGNPEDKCLCVGEQGLVEKFRENIVHPPGEWESGGEALFKSFASSLEPSKLAENKAGNQVTGCYRDYAALIMVGVGDENEPYTSPGKICATGNIPAAERNGTSASYIRWEFDVPGPAVVADSDDNCIESRLRFNHYSHSQTSLIRQETLADGSSASVEVRTGSTYLTAQELVSRGHLYSGPLGFLVETVGYINEVPKGTENERAIGLMEASELTGGDLVDMKLATDQKQGEFNTAFENLGKGIGSKVKLLTTFHLGKKACAGSIAVRVDSQTVPVEEIVFDGEKMVSIPASQAGTPGSVVQITYDVCGE